MNNVFKIEIDSVLKDAELLKSVSIEGRDYAIYAIDKGDDTSDILASRIIKNEEGKEVLVDLESDDERSKIKEIVTAMFS